MTNDTHIAVLGGLRRAGHFQLRRRTVAVALIGGADLDLTEAAWPAEPVVEIVKVSLVGGVTLTVPQGVAVELRGFSLVGGHDVKLDGSAPTGRTVRLRHFALVGGVKVRST